MKFLFSSIGIKIQIALSGILLSFFLLFHLLNNIVLFSGAENFNNMVSFLKSVHILVRIMEFGLLFIVLLHIVNAIVLTIKNKQSNGGSYAIAPQPETVPLYSRAMIISGLTIFLFFIMHLRYFWYTFQISEGSYFNIVLQNKFGFLGHLPTAIFYIISIIFISLHLRHGILSSLKTFGVSHYYRNTLFKYIAFIFWGIIPISFIIIILSIQIGVIS